MCPTRVLQNSQYIDTTVFKCGSGPRGREFEPRHSDHQKDRRQKSAVFSFAHIHVSLWVVSAIKALEGKIGRRISLMNNRFA